MADRLPSLPLFVDDYDAATSHLTLEEDGAYSRLLRLCWRSPRCTIPDDPQWIMRQMRVDRETFDRVIEPLIKEFFKRARGRVFQKRLLQEFVFAVDRQTRRKEAGKRGGTAKSARTNEKEPSNARAMLGQSQGIALARAGVLSPPHPIVDEEDKSSPSSAREISEKRKVPDRDFPDWLPSEEWGGFVAMRKKIGKPLSDRAVTLALNKLTELRNEGYDPGKVLDQSTFKDWQGLFPLKDDSPRQSGEPANFLDHLTQRRREEQTFRERQQQEVST